MTRADANYAFRLAGVGTSDCRFTQDGRGGWELRSFGGRLIATVDANGAITKAS